MSFLRVLNAHKHTHFVAVVDISYKLKLTTVYMYTSGMLSIVGEQESVHAKLEARTYIRHYGIDSMDSVGYIYIYIYIDI